MFLSTQDVIPSLLVLIIPYTAYTTMCIVPIGQGLDGLTIVIMGYYKCRPAGPPLGLKARMSRRERGCLDRSGV